MSDLILPDESYKILGACFEVYKSMGCGFLESVYQECLEIEFEFLGIPFVSQPQTTLHYRKKALQSYFVPDFICYDRIIVEIKAVEKNTDQFRAQVINYLHATNLPLGILVNFGHHPKVEHERFALTRKKK